MVSFRVKLILYKERYMVRLLFFLFVMILPLTAQMVDIKEAENVARNWYTYKSGQRNNVVTSIETYGNRSGSVLYIVQFQKGHVLVSSDLRAIPILGYNLSQNFETKKLIAPVKALLDWYQQQIIHIQEQQERTAINPLWEKIRNQKFSQRKKSVVPMVTAQWGQGNPYNKYTPIDKQNYKTCVGCGATAIAQIMHYFKHPKKGKGSKSYYCRYTQSTISANFNVNYDWDNMPKKVYSSSSKEQIEAVAIISFHAGVACKMKYGFWDDQSFSWPGDICDALRNHFDYSRDVKKIARATHIFGGWSKKLYKELDSGRPIVYEAVQTNFQGAHYFILDGYDGEHFHINWGWRGSYDGYYTLKKMNPGNSNFSFGLSQIAIINIKPSR